MNSLPQNIDAKVGNMKSQVRETPALSAKKIADASILADLSPFKALIFHRENEKLKSFISILHWCGLQDITDVTQLKEAIEHLVSTRFDFIFMTHIGEAEDATRLIDELKSLDATSDIPLIAITNDGDMKNVMRILAKGVDEVIVTPLSRKTVENVAIKILEKHTGADPVKVKLDLAKKLLETEQFDAAREIYQELIAQARSLLEAHLGIAEVYGSTQQWKEMESSLKKALELAKSAPTKLDAHLQLADVFFHYGNMYIKRDSIEKALKCYQTSVSLNTFHTGSLNSLLELLQRRDQEDEIIKLIGEVRANFLPYSRAMEEMALCLGNMAQRFTDMNMPSQAKKIYEQLLQFSHGNVAVHLKVADFFLEEGLVSQVLERLINLLQKLKDADILYKTGNIFLDIENRYLAQSCTANSADTPDLSFLGDFDRNKALLMAERMFQQGLLLEPESFRFVLNLVKCHIRQTQWDAAAEGLERLKERLTEDVHAFEEVIEMLIAEKAYDYANGWLKEAVNIFSGEIAFYLLFARLYVEQNQVYDAIGWLKRSLSVDPSYAESMVRLADLYQDIEDFSDSIYYYEMAIKHVPNDQSLHEKLSKVLKRKYAK